MIILIIQLIITIMEFTQEEKMYSDIVQKAWEDNAFKEELIANPVATIEGFTGKKMNLPEGKTLLVKDQSNDSFLYFNIPVKSKVEDVELNENQLDIVAGGSICPYPIKWPPVFFPEGIL
jgi:hypothetical protein